MSPRDHRPAPHAWRGGIIALGLIAASVASLSNAVAQQSGDADANEITAPTVDWSHGKRAHGLVEDWVHAGRWGPAESEDGEPEPAPTIQVRGVSAVKVTLRNRGQFAGAGAAYRDDLNALVEAKGRPVDLVAMVQRATEKALKQARQAKLDARSQALQTGLKGSIDRPSMRDVGRRLQVGLQIARSFNPIRVGADAATRAVYAQFAPGYHGLRLIAGADAQQSQAFLWPAEAVASNASPKSQLVRLLDDVGLAFTDLERVARPEGPRLQHFRVIHLVRPRLDLPVQRLKRSHVIMPAHAVREATLDGMADRLDTHLFNRFTDRGVLRGTYHPATSSYDPPLAAARDQALGCYAITRHAARVMKSGENQPFARRHARRALRTATRLGQKQLENGAFDPPTAALVVMTLIDTPRAGADQTLRDELIARLKATHMGDGRFRAAENEDDGNTNGDSRQTNQQAGQGSNTTGQKEMTQPNAALIAAALATAYDQTRAEDLRAIAGDAVHRSWQRASQNMSIAALPWLGRAHVRLVDLLRDDQGNLPERVKTRQREIATLIDQFADRQIIEAPELGPKDVIGGFQLRDQPSSAPPAPDWHTAQILTLLAAMMRDDTLMQDQNRFGWLLTAGLAGRFLGQLMMDEPACYFVTSQGDALGGVRLALWDNRLPVTATAMSLIAINELQLAVEANES